MKSNSHLVKIILFLAFTFVFSEDKTKTDQKCSNLHKIDSKITNLIKQSTSYHKIWNGLKFCIQNKNNCKTTNTNNFWIAELTNFENDDNFIKNLPTIVISTGNTQNELSISLILMQVLEEMLNQIDVSNTISYLLNNFRFVFIPIINPIEIDPENNCHNLKTKTNFFTFNNFFTKKLKLQSNSSINFSKEDLKNLLNIIYSSRNIATTILLKFGETGINFLNSENDTILDKNSYNKPYLESLLKLLATFFSEKIHFNVRQKILNNTNSFFEQFLVDFPKKKDFSSKNIKTRVFFSIILEFDENLGKFNNNTKSVFMIEKTIIKSPKLFFLNVFILQFLDELSHYFRPKLTLIDPIPNVDSRFEFVLKGCVAVDLIQLDNVPTNKFTVFIKKSFNTSQIFQIHISPEFYLIRSNFKVNYSCDHNWFMDDESQNEKDLNFYQNQQDLKILQNEKNLKILSNEKKLKNSLQNQQNLKSFLKNQQNLNFSLKNQQNMNFSLQNQQNLKILDNFLPKNNLSQIYFLNILNIQNAFKPNSFVIHLHHNTLTINIKPDLTIICPDQFFNFSPVFILSFFTNNTNNQLSISQFDPNLDKNTFFQTHNQLSDLILFSNITAFRFYNLYGSIIDDCLITSNDKSSNILIPIEFGVSCDFMTKNGSSIHLFVSKMKNSFFKIDLSTNFLKDDLIVVLFNCQFLLKNVKNIHQKTQLDKNNDWFFKRNVFSDKFCDHLDFFNYKLIGQNVIIYSQNDSKRLFYCTLVKTKKSTDFRFIDETVYVERKQKKEAIFLIFFWFFIFVL